MTVVPPIPMLLVAIKWEGMEQRISQSLVTSFDAPWAVTGLLYTCVLGTVAGSGIWTWLLSRHPVSAVAPFSMMVPVFGLSAAARVLGERINSIEFAGCVAGTDWCGGGVPCGESWEGGPGYRIVCRLT